jgi:hypothetical protein
MSQGSNFKKEVMEALFNAPTNLITSKAILWADSNLPAEGGNGEHASVRARKYDHDAESFWDAIGLGQEHSNKIHDKVRDKLFSIAKRDGSMSKSAVFQEIESEIPDALVYFAVHGFMKHYDALKETEMASVIASALGIEDTPDGLSDLAKAIEALKKSLKGGDK